MTDVVGGAGGSEPAGRASYLLAGRRVGIADLVRVGLLRPGDQLTFERPRVGETHSAQITDDAQLKLIDGQLFKSPSTAAIAAVGGGSFDGWHAWALPDGRMLDALRQELLDNVAQVSEGDEETPIRSTARHEMLKQARESAEQGHPKSLPVRDLLQWWGAERRGYLISQQISAELANHSLSTSPDFEAVGLDVVVDLVGASTLTEIQPEPETPAQAVASSPVRHSEEDTPVLGLTVGNLRSALTGVVSVSPSSTFEEAITEMVINGFSQLPVIAGTRNLRGAVTWESIARARHVDPQAPFSKAIIPAHDVPYDQHLIDVLPLLADYNFVLVRDQTNAIAGIVTANDVAMEYGSMATPFFLIGEFDQRLRRILAETFTIAHVATLCAPDGNRTIGSFDDLSVGDYQRILESEDSWKTLGWPLDRKVFIKRIDELRVIRNDLMHFNPDPIPDDAVQKIRHMIALLREYSV
ncbi:CBS domain-containing protein [Kitasatospora sp. A2-31]|uniref:restriction system modified-DNA reader domain-containing protein n=1 Tax=Kitasatospora sp. A2-31 TaxID=2916414 RepID=UPI001EEC66EA|nr:CBS domain-containing protein [Kitasatospora sp. A2-31]MCG6494858.1 CBS domain-containing protein [Kitasatospora sp. A2-31]